MNGSRIPEQQRRVFLTALAKDACVARAAKKAGRRPNLFYALRDHDDFFALAWETALAGRVPGTKYANEADRQKARRRSWRVNQAKRRELASQFPTFENYQLWLRATPHQKWWLERIPIRELRAMAGVIDQIIPDHSEAASLRRREGPTRVAA